MTATYDLSTAIGKVRLAIHDTDTAHAVFTDEELTEFLTANDNSVNLAAATALESWAASYSTNVASEKIGDYAYTQKVVENMLALAKHLRATDAGVPAMTWSEMDLVDSDSED